MAKVSWDAERQHDNRESPVRSTIAPTARDQCEWRSAAQPLLDNGDGKSTRQQHAEFTPGPVGAAQHNNIVGKTQQNTTPARRGKNHSTKSAPKNELNNDSQRFEFCGTQSTPSPAAFSAWNSHLTPSVHGATPGKKRHHVRHGHQRGNMPTSPHSMSSHGNTPSETLHCVNHGQQFSTPTPTPPVVDKQSRPTKVHINLSTHTLAKQIPNAAFPHTLGAQSFLGLLPPCLDDGSQVLGATISRLRIQNKRRRVALQLEQPPITSWWTTHSGTFVLPPITTSRPTHRNQMCPTGLALHHPAANLLLQYAKHGCPVHNTINWSLEQMQQAIDRGPHSSALLPDVIKQFSAEVQEKVQQGQAKVVPWASLCGNPPKQLKISPISAVPHKSRKWRAILDLSFSLHLDVHRQLPSVNASTIKTAPAGAIDQIGHSLARIIHAVAEAADDELIYAAKWDVKDGFWRMGVEESSEWNFAYVLPQPVGAPTQLVIPTSLQMGWVESPAYFCAATETARDVAQQYAELPLGKTPNHKFLPFTRGSPEYDALPHEAKDTASLRYLMEIYVDDLVSLAIAQSQQQLDHVADAIMTALHEVFPPAPVDEEDPISKKKLEKGEGVWNIRKEILGFIFDGQAHTIQLSTEKRNFLIATLEEWLQLTGTSRRGINFVEFRSIMAKVRHAFTAIPAGRGLMSHFNKLLQLEPRWVYLH